MNNKFTSIIGIFIIVIFFILSSYIVEKNLDFFRDNLNGVHGIFLYIFIVIIAEVIAPVSAIPLLPVASNVWGWYWAAILSIIGWVIGAIIAFEIARKFGVPLVKKLVPLEQIYKIEKKIPTEHVFLSVVLLRITIPVDLLSYALGLFSSIKRKDYILATTIGVIPFGFILAYIGTLPFFYQIIGIIIAFVIILIGILSIYNKKRIKDYKIKKEN